VSPTDDDLDTDWTRGELVRTVKRIERAVEAIPDKIAGQYVTTGVYEERNKHVDAALEDVSRRRVAWPSVVSAVAALGALTVMLLYALPLG